MMKYFQITLKLFYLNLKRLQYGTDIREPTTVDCIGLCVCLPLAADCVLRESRGYVIVISVL